MSDDGMIMEDVAEGRNGGDDHKSLAFYDALLRGAVHRGQCPPTDMLLMLSADLLDAEARTEIQRHVDQCQFCTEDLGILAVTETADAPSAVEKPWWSGLVEQGVKVIEAVFVPNQKPAFELRGETSEMRRYVAGEYEVILEIKKEEGRGLGMNFDRDSKNSILGQLSMPNDDELSDGSTVGYLYVGDTKLQTTGINEFGMFQLEGLEDGVYNLRISIDGFSFVISSLIVNTDLSDPA